MSPLVAHTITFTHSRLSNIMLPFSLSAVWSCYSVISYGSLDRLPHELWILGDAFGCFPGGFFPFSSEAVMLGLLAAGLHPVPLVVYGTIGNVLGSMFNYVIGTYGKAGMDGGILHVKRIPRKGRAIHGRGGGAWMGFFAFLPIIGSITIALGLMRANIDITLTSITVGKLLRYVVLVGGVSIIF